MEVSSEGQEDKEFAVLGSLDWKQNSGSSHYTKIGPQGQRLGEGTKGAHGQLDREPGHTGSEPRTRRWQRRGGEGWEGHAERRGRGGAPVRTPHPWRQGGGGDGLQPARPPVREARPRKARSLGSGGGGGWVRRGWERGHRMCPEAPWEGLHAGCGQEEEEDVLALEEAAGHGAAGRAFGGGRLAGGAARRLGTAPAGGGLAGAAGVLVLESPARGLPPPQVLSALDRDASCRKHKLRQKLEQIIGLVSSNS